MAAITWFEVEQYAPELAGTRVSALAQAMIIAVTNEIVAAGVWGTEDSGILRMARVLWAAHTATLERRKGLAGASASRSAGGISESYGPGPVSTSYLGTTSYGQMFLTLAKTRSFRAGFTTGMAVK